MDYAVKADVGLKPGQVAKSEDQNGRRIILLGIRFGNVVVFERFSPEKNTGKRSETIVGNYPREVMSIFRGLGGIGSSLEEDGLVTLIGQSATDCFNIGTSLERLFK